MPTVEASVGHTLKWISALIAAALFSTGCSSFRQPEERTYMARIDQTERRRGPGGERTEMSRLIGTIVELHDDAGTLLTVAELLNENGPMLPAAAVAARGATVRVTPTGELIVDLHSPTQRIPATLLVLRLILPLVSTDSEPRNIRWEGESSPTAITRIERSRLEEKSRDLSAGRISTTMKVQADLEVTAYKQDRTGYTATLDFGQLVPADPAVPLPTKTETYVRQPGFGDRLGSFLSCLFSFGRDCDTPMPATATRVVTVDGPAMVGATLTGPLTGEISSLVYERGGGTLLQAQVRGHDQIGGALTTATGVPASIAAKPVGLTTDWTVTTELSSAWPAAPRPTFLLLFALLLAAASTACVVLVAYRRILCR